MGFFLPELFVNLTSFMSAQKVFSEKKAKAMILLTCLLQVGWITEMYLKEFELVTLFDVHFVVLWLLH